MKVESLEELRAAFAEWRSRKRHARERMPEGLLVRAREATKRHGVTAVVGVTRVQRSRLFRSTTAIAKSHEAARTSAKDVPRPVPTFSRLELGAPLAPSRGPVVEVETRSGLTLRVFQQTPEMMGLLCAVCGFGGVR